MQDTTKPKFYLSSADEIKISKNDDYDYSKYSDLKDFVLDEELKGKFAPVAKKLNLSQESVEMLLDIALEMSQKQKANYDLSKDQMRNENITKYGSLFEKDSDIPSKNSIRINEYMKIANTAFREFASVELQEILAQEGLVYHPELIKMFFKIGELALEDDISFCAKPPVKELTPAQILYGNSNQNA